MTDNAPHREDDVKNVLLELEQSASLTEVKNLLDQCDEYLNFDLTQDPERLITYQNAIRNRLIEKLEAWLLSPHPPSAFGPQDRKALETLLNQERFIYPEEKSFFLSEFDHRLTSDALK